MWRIWIYFVLINSYCKKKSLPLSWTAVFIQYTILLKLGPSLWDFCRLWHPSHSLVVQLHETPLHVNQIDKNFFKFRDETGMVYKTMTRSYRLGPAVRPRLPMRLGHHQSINLCRRDRDWIIKTIRNGSDRVEPWSHGVSVWVGVFVNWVTGSRLATLEKLIDTRSVPPQCYLLVTRRSR